MMVLSDDHGSAPSSYNGLLYFRDRWKKGQTRDYEKKGRLGDIKVGHPYDCFVAVKWISYRSYVSHYHLVAVEPSAKSLTFVSLVENP